MAYTLYPAIKPKAQIYMDDSQCMIDYTFEGTTAVN